MSMKNITTLADTQYLKLYDAQYINKNGECKNWSIASRKNIDTLKNIYFNKAECAIDAVIIIATHTVENKLVIIKQFRVPLNDYVYEIPAGLIDPGEDFKTTVARELKEETGLDLIQIDYSKTKSQAYISTGMTDESAALVYCTCQGKISKDYLEPDEDIEVILLSKAEAKVLIDSDKKIDIKAFLSIQNFIA
ncbi:NUDIX hydrolase [Clostridium estertheticum]|uniref:DNA mismatch repair protein MutT n=1 Tax=Clostridium estertheticum subsp. estertheticum TaxID=1552 RepID=A0A1J0GEP5_9CLOT|nr:NUDIX hydrolase [Clostridium estertheticum]APC39735.1 DNA mismatch repair protein MutT [Clostridium estertheticum subsp. estertheticum]MBU3075743.1 NUDIX hydrolase [Clostridium estertheticum]MBU3165769.1 NUDIX hydrolase [Clostridium estertheticum]MBU3172107.1 NUDIX hydrolase [Clostridium estertheticum]MBU3185092.1 NUDIX hydrolase [Clostridium estertheticum]